MQRITIQDLYDAKLPRLTLDMVEQLDVPDVKQFISDNSVIAVEVLNNLPARQLSDMLLLIYNSQVTLMVAQTDAEESKEERSELQPSEINEGFINDSVEATEIPLRPDNQAVERSFLE